MAMTTPLTLANITVVITLSALPVDRAGFGTVMVLVDQAGGNGLDGDRVRSYTSISDVSSDEDNSYISAAVSQKLQDMFAQPRKPTTIKVGRIDTAGGETYSTGYDAVKAADDDFYVVAIDKRTDAEILLVSADVENEKRIFVCQSDDADWLTSGVPASLSALSGRERTVVCWHDADAEHFDACLAAYRLTFDPDEQSATWRGALNEVAPYSTTTPTAAQEALAIANNANLLYKYGTSSRFAHPGVNMNGRDIYEIVSSDWYSARIEEDTIALDLRETAAGRKILVTETGGGAQILAILDQRIQQGIAAGHFTEGEASLLAITQADRDNNRLRFDVNLVIGVGAYNFTFNVYQSTTPLAEQ